ncbi:hypothetical protein [Hymenobacter antarcticus]|uniref:Uncharacterized protein n=1 Tax=Hymenobacter antarcticus TaxID=486270 RepID=A0ABP7QC32_9BACT
MMITPAPAPKQPEICPSQWLNSVTPCPQWIGYPTRLSLPIDLIWSADFAVPEIGSRVHIYMNGFGPAEVKAYFHADGYLGVICQPDEMPDWYKKQAPGITLGYFFGRELEPRKPTPAPAAAAAVPEENELGRWSDQLDAAHEANGNNPAINRPDDWIPEYADDNQDHEEYPEHPGDEQHDYPEDDYQDAEAEALGDLHNSQFED